jgi:hypothetical protein
VTLAAALLALLGLAIGGSSAVFAWRDFHRPRKESIQDPATVAALLGEGTEDLAQLLASLSLDEYARDWKIRALVDHLVSRSAAHYRRSGEDR